MGGDSVRGYGISYERYFGSVTYNASFNPPASAVVAMPVLQEIQAVTLL